VKRMAPSNTDRSMARTLNQANENTFSVIV
jgi:hypothetical protein